MIDSLAAPPKRSTFAPWIALAVIVALAGALRYANLDALGSGNQYYTAAVNAMLQSPTNFFFAAAEPGGGVSVDKPPFGLWIQTISAAIFGVNGFAVALPSILAGMASVALLYWLVSRRFGALAGLIAAFVLATTPVAVAVDGTNNLDSLLIFALLLATWAWLRAIESGRLAPLLLGAALVGIGFNIKMLQAFLVVPALYAAYFLGARVSWAKKLVYLGGAGVVLLVVSFAWAVIVDLTPADQRPYVGGSQTNSVIELALGYNGLQRLTGGMGVPGGAARDGGQMIAPPGGGGNPTSSEVGEPGLLRVFSAPLENELSWALPLALFMLTILVASEKLTLPLGDQHRALVLWGGWLLTGLAFFTVSEFFHAYYLATIAPPMAALIGIGAATAWRSNRVRLLTLLLIGAVAGTLVYQWVTADAYGAPIPLSRFAAVVALACGIAVFGASYWLPKWRRFAAPTLVAAALIIPATWGVLTAQEVSTNSVLPSSYSGTRQEGMMGAGMPANAGSVMTDALRPILDYLQEHQTSKYLIAVSSSMIGAPIVLATSEPVLYLGGFNGSDPIYSEESIAALVASGDARYFLTGGSSVDTWVTATCRAVEEVGFDLSGMIGGLPPQFGRDAQGGRQGFQPPAGFAPGRGELPALYDCQAAI